MSTKATADNRKEYKKVMHKLDEFFKVRRNVIFERARFSRRDQLPGETAEEYITALYSMIDACEYDERFKDEMLRDCLVVGIRDKALSERLQMDADLKLETTKTSIRQREAVKEQQSLLPQGEEGIKSSPICVGSIRRGASDRSSLNSQQTRRQLKPMEASLERTQQKDSAQPRGSCLHKVWQKTDAW